MKTGKKHGYVLVFIMMALALIGTEIYLLTSSSNDILFQANDALLQTTRQNLTASGLAWARINAGKNEQTILNKMIELNTADFNVKRATLSVIFENIQDEKARVQIEACCRRGRQTLKHQKRYEIELQ